MSTIQCRRDLEDEQTDVWTSSVPTSLVENYLSMAVIRIPFGVQRNTKLQHTENTAVHQSAKVQMNEYREESSAGKVTIHKYAGKT